MKQVFISVFAAALITNEAGVQAATKKDWGKGGRNSPFEQFRNPNAEINEGAAGPPPTPEPETLPEEEKFEFEKVMTPEEEACYSSRYSDIGNMTANEHYARVGQKQGRNINCQDFMTGIQAERYLRRYWQLGVPMGHKGDSAFADARDHWYNNGSKASPPLSIKNSYPTDAPYKCSDYGKECHCPGRIHFGHKKRLDTGDEITELKDLMNFNVFTKWEEGFELHISCDRHSFKKGHAWDGVADDDLQCFCEPFLQPEPFHCSADGGTCTCPKGNVFYGNKFTKGSTSEIATFQQMLNQGTYLLAGEIKDSISCEPKSFVGGEIFDSGAREMECYCDDKNFVDITYINSEIHYWTSLIEERRAHEFQARVEAEAEAARAQAAYENDALKAKLAAAEAQIKEAEAAYARAQQQAEADRAAQEAADKAAAEAAAKAEAAREKQLQEERAARDKAHAEAIKAAEAAATAAAKEKAAEKRRQLLADAEKAKQEAIKQEVAAALAAQQEEHLRIQAEQQAKAEEDKRKQQAAMEEMKRLQEAEEKKRIAIEEAKKAEMIAEMEEAHAEELAAQAEQAKAAAQKQLAQALEDQQKAFEEKMAAEEAERQRIKKLEEEEERKKLAAKLAAEKAAEEAKRKAEEEEALRKAAELAAHRQLIEDEKAAAAEEARLAKEALEDEKKRAEAEMAAKKAASDLALAKTEADRQRALAAQKAAEDAQREAEEAEAAARHKKQALEADIAKKKLIADLAAKAAQEAKEQKLKAQAEAAEWQRQAKEAAEESKRQQEAAAKELADKQAEMELKRLASKAKYESALKEQAETFRLASLAAEEAHKAAEAARRAKEEEQIAAHKRQMAARRTAFEKAFRNVWATGDTGVSLIHLTMPGHSDELITKLYKKTMVADVADYKTDIKKSWLSNNHISYDSTRHRLVMISSDDRVAEVIEETASFMAKFNEPHPFDLVVTPLATGSKEYIEWVKLQTLKKDDSTAFFNVQAESEIEALTTRV